MRQLFMLLSFLYSAHTPNPPTPSPCHDLLIGAADLTPVTALETELRRSLDVAPLQSYAWLIPGPTAQIDLRARSRAREIAETVTCCGLSVEDAERVLVRSAHDGSGVITVHKLYQHLFSEALHRSAIPCENFQCVETAFTWFNPELSPFGTSIIGLHQSERPTEFAVLSHFFQRIGGLHDARRWPWGQLLILEGTNPLFSVAHAFIALGNGYVLHKPGSYDARVEPLTTAMAGYISPNKPNEIERLSAWGLRDIPLADLLDSAPQNYLNGIRPTPPERR